MAPPARPPARTTPFTPPPSPPPSSPPTPSPFRTRPPPSASSSPSTLAISPGARRVGRHRGRRRLGRVCWLDSFGAHSTWALVRSIAGPKPWSIIQLRIVSRQASGTRATARRKPTYVHNRVVSVTFGNGGKNAKRTCSPRTLYTRRPTPSAQRSAFAVYQADTIWHRSIDRLAMARHNGRGNALRLPSATADVRCPMKGGCAHAPPPSAKRKCNATYQQV